MCQGKRGCVREERCVRGREGVSGEGKVCQGREVCQGKGRCIRGREGVSGEGRVCQGKGGCVRGRVGVSGVGKVCMVVRIFITTLHEEVEMGRRYDVRGDGEEV